MPGVLVHAAMPYQVSCVAGFQGECAEEEGAGGPEGDDAEALPGGERQAVQSDRGLGVQAGGQGPIWSRCRARAGLEMTSAASGNRYSTPSTRPMAAAESRTAAPSPRLSRAMSVRYKTAPAAARRAVAEVRDVYPCAGVKPLPGRISRPASAAPATASAEAVSTGAVSTVALANSQVSRRGIAVSDSLIIPVLYSLPMASTPATAATAW